MVEAIPDAPAEVIEELVRTALARLEPLLRDALVKVISTVRVGTRPLSGDADRPSDDGPIKDALANAERRRIESALDECDGNITHAAERLGLLRQGLQQRMNRLGMKRPRRSPDPS